MERIPIDLVTTRPTSLADSPPPPGRADIVDPPPASPGDPDKPCYHPDFEAVVDVGRIGEDDENNLMPGMPTAFVADVTIKCGKCSEPFKFDGVPAGMSYDAPSTSWDGFTLRAPVRPESLPPRRMRLKPGSGVSGVRIEGYVPGDKP